MVILNRTQVHARRAGHTSYIPDILRVHESLMTVTRSIKGDADHSKDSIKRRATQRCTFVAFLANTGQLWECCDILMITCTITGRVLQFIPRTLHSATLNTFQH
jgi:hypothetical protein